MPENPNTSSPFPLPESLRESPILRFFEVKHLPASLAVIAAACSEIAWQMEVKLPPGPEKSAGLRKLLEAKDCFVRAALPQEDE